MAIAEPVLRNYGIQRLRGLKPGSVIGTAVGIGISIGYGLLKDYDVTFPWDTRLEPDRPYAGVVKHETPSNGSTNKQYQALRTSYKQYRRKRRYSSTKCCKCCC